MSVFKLGTGLLARIPPFRVYVGVLEVLKQGVSSSAIAWNLRFLWFWGIVLAACGLGPRASRLGA